MKSSLTGFKYNDEVNEKGNEAKVLEAIFGLDLKTNEELEKKIEEIDTPFIHTLYNERDLNRLLQSFLYHRYGSNSFLSGDDTRDERNWAEMLLRRVIEDEHITPSSLSPILNEAISSSSNTIKMRIGYISLDEDESDLFLNVKEKSANKVVNILEGFRNK